MGVLTRAFLADLVAQGARQGQRSQASPPAAALVGQALQMVGACAFLSHCRGNPTAVSEPEWYAAASLFAFCEGGDAAFHAFSKPDPRYSEAGTQAKLEQARARTKPRTCKSISEELGCAACSACHFNGTIKSPISLAKGNAPLVEIASRYVHVTELNSFLDTQTGALLDNARLTAKWAHRFSKAKPATAALAYSIQKKVDRLVYRPGAETFLTESNATAVNIYKDDRAKPIPGVHPHIDLALEAAVPVKSERDFMLDQFAMAVQQPDIKQIPTLLLSGSQGTGKNTVGYILERLVGPSNFRTQSGASLAGRFWDDLVNTVVLYLDEVSLEDRRETSNRFKQLQSEDTIPVERKGLPFTRELTPRLIILASNHDVPVTIEDGDRRFFVTTYQSETKPASFWKEIYTHIDEEVGAFMRSLLDRDISAYNPKAPAPDTEAKRAIISESRPALQVEIDQMVKDRARPFHSDLILPDSAVRWLEQRGHRVTQAAIRRAFKALGYTSLRQIAPGSHLGETRAWCIRNPHQWQSATAAELRDQLLRQVSHSS